MRLAAAHRAFDVQESSQPGEVRRAAVRMAQELGFQEAAVGKVALVATELGSNLVKYGLQGRMLIAPVRGAGGASSVELLSLDKGPGIGDLHACLADGFSTGRTSGTGLGAVRRLSAEFDIFSQVARGTVVLARVTATLSSPSSSSLAGDPRSLAPLSIDAIALCAPGETACGDAWDAVQSDRRAAVMVADGLGHGPHAAEASGAAMEVFRADPLGVPKDVLGRVHLGLKGTRGAAVAMAHINLEQDTITFSGVGNIIGRIISAVEDRTLISQNGTAGMQIRRLQDVSYAWPAHSLLVMHSDGIVSRWNAQEAPGLLQHHPALVAAWLIRDYCRGNDDTTVVVIRRRRM